MTKYIPDSSKTRWMVSNPKRQSRTGMDGKPFRCPFCPGNEADTPPELYRTGEGNKDGPGWSVRVVPNLFPITEIHEVIIHSPDHDGNLEDLDPEKIAELIGVYVNRFNANKDKGKVFIFSNQSLASGASLVHSHSQVSVVPADVPTVTLPFQKVVNIVEQIGDFISYCPEYSEWSYEVWITLMKNEKLKIEKEIQNIKFENLNEIQIRELADILQSAIKKLKKIHDGNSHYSKKEFGYNICIQPYGDWYVRIIPRFMERAGFELSTGLMVNSVDPESASFELKKP